MNDCAASAMDAEGRVNDNDRLIDDQLRKTSGATDTSTQTAASLTAAIEDLTQSSRPFHWGYSFTSGTLGHAKTSVLSPWRLISTSRNINVKQITAADRITLFLTCRNEVFQCGHLVSSNSGSDARTPRRVDFPTNGSASIVSIRAANYACYALDDLGKVYAWGCFGKVEASFEDVAHPVEKEINSSWEGQANCEKKDVNHSQAVYQAPVIVLSLSHLIIKKIRPGNGFVIAIDDSGHAFAWGRNRFGQLGLGHTFNVMRPQQIETIKDRFVVDLEANYSHVLAILTPRRTGGLVLYTLIFSWGKAHFGCLGREENASSTSPREVTFFRGLNASQIATGMDHSVVLCLAGKRSFLYTFGGNQFGQLGLGVPWQYSVIPQLVDRLSQVSIVSMSAGSSYSVAVSAKGELYSWGDGMYGKNSTGGGGISCVPKKIDSFRNFFVTQVFAGKSNGVGLLRNSTKQSVFVTRDCLTAQCHVKESK